MFCFFSFVTSWMTFATSQRLFSVTLRLVVQLKDPLRISKTPLRMPRRVILPSASCSYPSEWYVIKSNFLLFTTKHIFLISHDHYCDILISFYHFTSHQRTVRMRQRPWPQKSATCSSENATLYFPPPPAVSGPVSYILSCHNIYFTFHEFLWFYHLVLIVISQTLFIVSHGITWSSKCFEELARNCQQDAWSALCCSVSRYSC